MSRFRSSGGFRTTCSFQTATLIYDATYWFCEKFLDPRSRTVDQMVQAARSGRHHQITALEKAFIMEGGYSEQLASARLAHRSRKNQPAATSSSAQIPVCLKCGKPTVLRTAKTGPKAGRQFWGCAAYPDCTGVVSL